MAGEDPIDMDDAGAGARGDAGAGARGDAEGHAAAPPEPPPLRPGLTITLVLAVVLGGLAGMAVSGVAYLVVIPWLEGSPVEEFTGMRWTVVLFGTLAGVAGGAGLLLRRRRRRRGRAGPLEPRM